jgi:hypothetical protein
MHSMSWQSGGDADHVDEADVDAFPARLRTQGGPDRLSSDPSGWTSILGFAEANGRAYSSMCAPRLHSLTFVW